MQGHKTNNELQRLKKNPHFFHGRAMKSTGRLERLSEVHKVISLSQRAFNMEGG